MSARRAAALLATVCFVATLRLVAGWNPAVTSDYAAGYDSYLWLRAARNLVETGSPCDSVRKGTCINALADAPRTREFPNPRSWHTHSIAAVSRLMPGDGDTALFRAATAVTSLVAVSIAVPAFLIAAPAAGTAAGVAAALLVSLHPTLVSRTLSPDTDAWNAALPLWTLWLILAAYRSRRRLIAAAALCFAAVLTSGLIFTWSGWRAPFAMQGIALGTAAVWALAATHGGGRDVRGSYLTLGWLTGTIVLTSVFGTVELWRDFLFHGLNQASHYLDLPFLRTSDTLVRWPNVMAIVNEMQRPAALGAADSPGRWLHIVALAILPGLLVGHRAPSSKSLSAAIATGAVVLAFAAVGVPILALVTLTAILCGALLVAAPPPEGEARSRAIALIIVGVLLLIAVGLDRFGQRFALFAVAPTGLVLGIGLGRLRRSLLEQMGKPHPWHAIARALSLLALLACASIHTERAHALLSTHQPQIHQGWVDAFRHIADRAGKDEIVGTWWDHGYWAAYFARRPVLQDGGSLHTGVPYWFARAFLSRDEQETVGILRMLACGSATRPAPREAAGGTWKRLLDAGLTRPTALRTLHEIVRVERADAAQILKRAGVRKRDVRRVLAATHCRQDSLWLALGDTLTTSAIWTLGAWDFARAYAASSAKNRPRADLIDDLVREFDLRRGAARDLVQLSESKPARVNLPEGYLTASWVSCDKVGTKLVCPITSVISRGVEVLAFEYDTLIPDRSALWLDRDGRKRRTLGTVVATDDKALVPFPIRQADFPRLAALVDISNKRALLGTRRAILSIFTQAIFLDGRHLRHLVLDSHHQAAGERVSTFHVRLSE